MPTAWYEPTLRDLLQDPLVHAVMARDGTDAGHVAAMFEMLGRMRLQPAPALSNRLPILPE